MKFDDLLFSRRTRQNHALEHATFTILATINPTLSVSARSNNNGFIIFGDVDLGLLRRALDEALARLLAGEAGLAIHPNCGTNLAVGVSMVTIGTLLGMASIIIAPELQRQQHLLSRAGCRHVRSENMSRSTLQHCQNWKACV